MNQQYRFLIYSVLCLFALLGFIYYSAPPLSLQFPQLSCESAWCAYSEPSTNAFYLWRVSPILSLLQEYLAPTTSLIMLERVCYAVLLFLGLLHFSLVGTASPLSPRAVLLALLAATLATWCALLVIGHDRVAFASITLLPLCVGLFLSRSKTYPREILLVLSILGLVFTANQLALLVLCSALLIARAFDRILFKDTHTQLVIAGGLLLCVLSLTFTPEFHLPWYPQGSQVVPDDEIPGMLRPFVGPLPAVPFIDRWAVRDFYVPTLQLLLVGFGISFLIAVRTKTIATQLLLVAGIPLLFVYVDLRAPEPLSILTPLLVLPRVIPQIFFFPLEHLALAVTLIGLSMCIIRSTRLVMLLPLCAIVLLHSQFKPPEWQSPPDRGDVSNWQSAPEAERHLTLMRSPSQFLLRAYQFDALGDTRNWILERESRIRDGAGGAFRRVQRDQVILRASHNEPQLAALFSKRPHARWTSGEGRQRGNEWLQLKFNHIHPLSGIELFLGEYVTDFPRGIRVGVASDCNMDSPDPREFKTIINYPRWYGGIEFSPQGYPYFKGRYSTKIYFPEDQEVGCILLQQTGESDNSDWSIAEIRVLDAAC